MEGAAGLRVAASLARSRVAKSYCISKSSVRELKNEKSKLTGANRAWIDQLNQLGLKEYN